MKSDSAFLIRCTGLVSQGKEYTPFLFAQLSIHPEDTYFSTARYLAASESALAGSRYQSLRSQPSFFRLSMD